MIEIQKIFKTYELIEKSLKNKVKILLNKILLLSKLINLIFLKVMSITI